MFYVIVKVQLPLTVTLHVATPGVIIGSSQQKVVVGRVSAKGVTVTDTHTDTGWYLTAG
jgi:ribosomal protein S3